MEENAVNATPTPEVQQQPAQPEAPQEQMVSKAVLDKAMKERAELQRKLNSYLTEDERRAQAEKEKDDRIAQLEARVHAYDYARKVNPYLSGDQSQTFADRLAEGDIDGALTALTGALASMQDNHTRELQQAKLSAMPQPAAGTIQQTNDKRFADMSLDERMRLKASDPERYETLKRGE